MAHETGFWGIKVIERRRSKHLLVHSAIDENIELIQRFHCTSGNDKLCRRCHFDQKKQA
jgi:hypothetical protein